MSQILKVIGVGCAAVLLAGCATRYGPYHRWLNTGYVDSDNVRYFSHFQKRQFSD